MFLLNIASRPTSSTGGVIKLQLSKLPKKDWYDGSSQHAWSRNKHP